MIICNTAKLIYIFVKDPAGEPNTSAADDALKTCSLLEYLKNLDSTSGEISEWDVAFMSLEKIASNSMKIWDFENAIKNQWKILANDQSTYLDPDEQEPEVLSQESEAKNLNEPLSLEESPNTNPYLFDDSPTCKIKHKKLLVK